MTSVTSPSTAVSLVDPLAVATGHLNWNYTPVLSTSTVALGGNAILAQSIYLAPSTVITGMVLRVTTAAAGTKPTGFFVGLATPAKMVAQSNDLSGAAGVPLAATGPTKLAFNATYTTNAVDSPLGIYYVCVLQNGSWGTTQPKVGWFSSLTGTGSALAGSNPVSCTFGNGPFPANGSAVTQSANDSAIWVGLY